MASVPPSFLAILLAMAAGYSVRKAGWLHAPSARRIMIAVHKFSTPCVLLLSFWGLKLEVSHLLAVPLVGLGVIFFQYGLAFIAARFLGLKSESRGSFLIAAILSNVGYLGWSVNLALFGKPGFDFAFLFGFYFTFAVYVFAYPVAAQHSLSPQMRSLTLMKRLSVEGILAMAAGAILIGFLLNLSGVPRPAVLGRLNPFLVLASTTVLMFAAGLTLRIRALKPHAAPCIAISAIKLVVSPLAVAAALGAVSRFTPIDPVLFRVLVIESMMPLAISCLTISTIFRLNQDLMNGMWLVTTVLFFLLFRVALTMGIGL